MKSMVLHEPNKPLELEDVAVPEPGAGEVLVRVRACGLGLTLVWNRQDRQPPTTAQSKLPRIIGHEVAGDVTRTGPGVSKFQTGDRVAVYFYLTCGDCRWCNVAREDLCENFGGYVGQHVDGGLAEYIKVPVRNLCAIPAELGYIEAAMATDAIATPLHVLSGRARLAAAETVVVVGAGGGVGVHMVQMARALGGRTIAVDVTAEKLDLAREAGADATVDARDGAVDEQVRGLTDGRGADVVVELVGKRETLATSVGSLGTGGRIVFVGSYHPDARLSLNPRLLTSRELVLTGSRYCTRHELRATLDLVALGRVRPVVTRICSLEEAEQVLQTIEAGGLAGRAAVVI